MPTEIQPPQTGALVSEPDYRDEYAAAAAGTAAITAAGAFTLPETFATDLGAIMMQSQTPSCVSHSVVYLMKHYWFRKTGQWINFSPRFLDTLVKRYDGLGDPVNRASQGTYPRLVLKLAMQYGCATEDVLPNNTNLSTLAYRNDALLTDAVFANAAKWTIPGFIRVTPGRESTRRAIYLYGAVTTLFQIGNELWVPGWEKQYTDPLRTPKVVVSGHQMSQHGWSSPVLNSLTNEWSAAWADNGKTEFDYDAWAPFIIEQWAIAEVPADITSFLKDLPAQTNFVYTWDTDLLQGQTNDDVKYAQIAFMMLGFMTPVPPDQFGIYGPRTAAAVAKVQAAAGIPPASRNASRIGPMTRAWLNKKFGN